MRLELTHDQQQRFIDGLRSAYDQMTLDAMLYERLGKALASSVALPQIWKVIPNSLLQRAYMEAWNDDLLLAASASAPYERILADLVLELGFSAAGNGRLSISKSVQAKDDGRVSLEGLVKRTSRLQDVSVFIATLTQLQFQVCRIEITGTPTQALGTGFLVGDDLVLTNWHVAELISEDPGSIRCRFDYRADTTGLAVNEGFTVPLVSDGWLLHSRPYASSDVSAGGALPTSTDLDYALIKIAKSVSKFAPGKETAIEGASGRGFLRLGKDAPNPAVGQEIFVLQHPAGQPIKLAIGQIVDLVTEPSAPLRLRYDSTTQGGSSGSPCFNANLDLIALHHATDPEDPAAPTFNQAIPIGLIHNDLTAAGILH